METITSDAQDSRRPIRDDALQAVRTLLAYAGENPDREGLRETPRRVIDALCEMTSGMTEYPGVHLQKQFNEKCDEMVVLRGIPFVSLCEHHMLPFSGTCDIAYIPRSSVVGLSKLARLLDGFATRLQIQERLTKQVANALQDELEPIGVGVIVRASHSCMSCRGVRKHSSEMVTSSLHGLIKTDERARAEFLGLAR